tara:strand:- start:653 stop:1324 length:672 start_codon:yes stop_codon:yes gene_type:complete
MGFRIPESLHEITIGQYQLYMAAIEGLEENSEAMMELATVIFCNISLKDLRSLSRKEVDMIKIGVSKALKAFGDDQELVRRFWLNGIEYGFIPNLDTNISYGEHSDIVSYVREGVQSSHKVVSVLYRPITKSSKSTYKIKKYKTPVKNEESFKDAPVSILLGSQGFFYSVTKELLTHIPNYLRREMGEEKYQQMMKQESINLTGEGTKKSIALLKETLGGLTK